MSSEPNLLKFPGANAASGSMTDRRAGISATGGTTILGYFLIVRRYKWLLLSVVLVAGLLGWLKANSEIPIYQAQLTLLIEPKRAKLGGSIEDILQNYTSPYRFYQTQYEIIRSRAVAERIVEKLNLDRYLWIDRRKEPGLIDAIRIYIGRQTPQEKPAPMTDEQKRAFLTGLVQANLSVVGGDKSQIVIIRFESQDAQFAADVVNGAADAYIELSLDARLSAVKVASGWLDKQIEDLRKKVSESEARLQSFQAQEALVDSEKGQELVKSRLAALNESYTEAQSKFSALAKRYGDKHPSLVAARSEMNELRSRLQLEKGSVVDTQGKGFELAKLERDVATYRQLYDQFLTRFKETDLAMRYDINNVRVIDRAATPQYPVRPNKRQIVMSFVLAGLVLGVALAWFREHLDNTFKNPQDIENNLGMPVLGIVPYVEKKTLKKQKLKGLPERYFIHNRSSAFAESINHIRTGVLFTNVDSPPKIVMITSALPSEGKTTLSSNLALSFSQLGRTLLIDADLRKPRVAEISGLQPHGGLADVVAGHTKVADGFAKDQDAENLYIMKSGTQPPNPLELLSSEKFSKLLMELRKTFDHIVVDSPPVLPVSDAMVLGRLVDGVLLAVRANKTSRSASVNALNALNKSSASVFGAVLTQVTSRKMAYYYPDDYYGSYGEYYSDREAHA